MYQFERLSEEYAELRAQYDLAPLPHYNRTSKGNWMDYYDLNTARRVYKRYKRDIEAFGYQDAYEALIAYIQNKKRA